jgi:four helix bundle protein
VPWVPQVRGVSWVQVPSVPGALRLASCLCAALGALPKISHGTSPAPPNRVPYDHKELVVWQLADQLRIAVFALTENGAAARDFKYRDQIRDAVSSIARNLAEGFYRYEHPDFANFTRYARASLRRDAGSLTRGQKASILERGSDASGRLARASPHDRRPPPASLSPNHHSTIDTRPAKEAAVERGTGTGTEHQKGTRTFGTYGT